MSSTYRKVDKVVLKRDCDLQRVVFVLVNVAEFEEGSCDVGVLI